MDHEKSLGIIKPDAVERNLIGSIIKIIEDNDIKINQMKMLELTSSMAEEFYNIHSNFINEKNFLDKYQYINFERIKYLNSSVIFMQFLSYYNISSPILSLCSPIFVFIVPFFVLKLKKICLILNLELMDGEHLLQKIILLIM